jgi:Fe-S-cluster formation regulator IscX/YfhJ
LDKYDKVDPEEIIFRLKRLIAMLEAENKAQSNSNEKNFSNPS